MTTGGATLAWHANDTATAGLGAAYRLKSGAAGTFGNYFNFNTQPQFVSVTELSSAALAATNALQIGEQLIQKELRS
jgi:hypothetical protein